MPDADDGLVLAEAGNVGSDIFEAICVDVVVGEDRRDCIVGDQRIGVVVIFPVGKQKSLFLVG